MRKTEVWKFSSDLYAAAVVDCAKSARREAYCMLSGLPIFQSLSSTQLGAIVDLCEKETFAPDTAVGDGKHFFVVVTGNVVGLKDQSVYGAGAYFGELGLLTSSENHLDFFLKKNSEFRTKAGCECWRIRHDAFLRVLGPLGTILNGLHE